MIGKIFFSHFIFFDRRNASKIEFGGDKKKVKKVIELTGVVAIAMALTIAFSGVVLASQTVPKTPETEIFDITTNIACNGSVMENEEFSWKSSSKNLLDILPSRTRGSIWADQIR